MSIRHFFFLALLLVVSFAQFEEVKRRMGLRYLIDGDAAADVVGMMKQPQNSGNAQLLRGRYGKRSNWDTIFY
ncbi:unnamed protein product, partial [Mesorhabditis belari]|uniref:Uncharacterized protein n=1 Tax=Mesorhabditis belari TaxID=2138241 RepID=A0AAF3FB80_9BILA